jgi:SAM-dependent methyltransferase
MQYERIKHKITHFLQKKPALLKLFFLLLDMLLLRQWYIKAKIRKHFKGKAFLKMYDAGSGFGQYSYFILKNWAKAEVLALDLDDTYRQVLLDFLKKRLYNSIDYVIADLVEYKPIEKYDLILSVDVLEHIENDVQVLKHFHDILTSDGKLIISTPSDKDKAAAFVDEHVRAGYSRAEIKSKLNKAGFKIAELEFAYGKFGKIYWELLLHFPLKKLVARKKLLPAFFYYLVIYPFAFIFMLLDFIIENKSGNSMIIVAEKI